MSSQSISSSSEVIGSRKITLKRSSSRKDDTSNSPTISKRSSFDESTSNNDNQKKESTNITSSIVDSAFSNFVAKKMEQIGKEKLQTQKTEASADNESKDKSKKHKHKKSGKHKKHKHKDRSKSRDKKDKQDSLSDSSEAEESGFFAKEGFLTPGEKEIIPDDKSEKSLKSKKHKKHKHKEHKHKRREHTNEKEDKETANGSPKNIFFDKYEKQIESKLHSLKENLNKKHKALEDLKGELQIPEKKIKIMTALTISDKCKSEEKKSEQAAGNSAVVDSGSAFAEMALKNNEEATTLKAATEGNDGEGFRAMKSRKEREEEAEEKTNYNITDVKNDNTTTSVKKSGGMKLGLKLSENSVSLISSGIRIENDPKKRNREEGEITDSQGSSLVSSSSSSIESDDDNVKESYKQKKRKSSKERSKRRSSRQKRKDSHRSKSPKRSRRSRSRSFDETRGVWKSSRRHRSRSRSRDRRKRSKDRDRSRRSRSKERSDRNFYYNDRYKVRSRSREKKDLRLKIDKAKLREIAMKNAFNMMGVTTSMAGPLQPEQIVIKSGGKSVAELTDFCKKIAEKDPNDSSSDEEARSRLIAAVDQEDDAAPFLNHPFIKTTPIASINMNIRNAKQLPVTSFADRTAKAGELRLQFPVSSGSQHKTKEDEWTPVEPKPAAQKQIVTATNSVAPQKPLPKPGALMPPPPPPPAKTSPATAASAVPAVKPEDRVFPEETAKINISDVVSERLSAMRKLQSNPNDVQAMGAMYKSQTAMNNWAQNSFAPGKFTGSTGVKVLSAKELQGGGYQAWAKKDQFHRAAPVRGGIGKLLLQKMGWREGTGLGREESGSLEPLNLDIKTDRKGLLSQDEAPVSNSGRGKVPQKVVHDLSGKHPVSALMELCKRKKWSQPYFELVFECGPPHKKNFVFKALVNGVYYQPTIASPNKKHAKAQAATVVLQQFGLVPKDQVL